MSKLSNRSQEVLELEAGNSESIYKMFMSFTQFVANLIQYHQGLQKTQRQLYMSADKRIREFKYNIMNLQQQNGVDCELPIKMLGIVIDI